MDVTIHWQDADSSAKAVREIVPKVESMLCGGHAGRAHKEKRQKDNILPLKHVDKDEFPVICKEEYQSCKCVGYHRSGCGCLSDSKAHTNFTNRSTVARGVCEACERFTQACS